MAVFKQDTATRDIIANGVVVIPQDEVIIQHIDNLEFHIEFRDEDQDDKRTSSRYNLQLSDDKKFLTITFINIKSSINICPENNIIPLATIKGKQLYLSCSLCCVTKNNNQEDHLFYYTWFLDK